MLYGAAGELPSLPALRASVGDALVDVATSEIDDDWPTRWRSFHHPVEVAGALRVRAPWHDPPAAGGGLLDLVIEPAQAFGTGAHATTRACLELLVELAAAGEARGSLLDLGTGSGVLAIAAARLGFEPVDRRRPRARSRSRPRATTRTANGVALDVRRARPAARPAAAAPTRSSPTCCARCCSRSPSGSTEPPRLLIASGLLREQADEVAAAFARARPARARAPRATATGRRSCSSAGDGRAAAGRGRGDAGGPDTRRRMLFSVASPTASGATSSTAMKAGDRERVGTLRMLLSELQKAAKEGSDDELAVLRRERKRRVEAERAFRDGGREDLADGRGRGGGVIAAYLPAELDDAELDAIVARAVAQSGAQSVKDLGRVMPIAMAEVAGRADGRRVSEQVRAALANA